MLRKAFVSSGVSYHHGLVQPGGPLYGTETPRPLLRAILGWIFAQEATPAADRALVGVR